MSTILQKYIPEEALADCIKLLQSEPIELRISKPRKTKLGDYRRPKENGKHRISINNNLNKYSFLITFLHEFAHLKAFKNHSLGIKAHGSEWQMEFIETAKSFLDKDIFPEDIKIAFIQSLNKGAASSCADLDLYRVLKKYDESKSIFVEDLSDGEQFSLNNGLVFQRGPKSRKRYKCQNLKNGKYYMVHPMAEVIPLNPN